MDVNLWIAVSVGLGVCYWTIKYLDGNRSSLARYSCSVNVYAKDGTFIEKWAGSFNVFSGEDVMGKCEQWLGLQYYYKRSQFILEIVSLKKL